MTDPAAWADRANAAAQALYRSAMGIEETARAVLFVFRIG